MAFIQKNTRRHIARAYAVILQTGNDLAKNGTIEFDQALRILFLSGDRMGAYRAKKSPSTIDRDSLLFALENSSRLFWRKRIPLNWETDYNRLLSSPSRPK